MAIERRRITVCVGNGGDGPAEIHQVEYDIPFEERQRPSPRLRAVPSYHDEAAIAAEQEVEEEEEEELEEPVMEDYPSSDPLEMDCLGTECVMYSLIGVFLIAFLLYFLNRTSAETCESEQGEGISRSRIADISGICPINY